VTPSKKPAPKRKTAKGKPTTSERALTDKQRRFVDEYLIDLNASQAAVRAGYTGDPNTIGPRLLANVGIRSLVARRMADRSHRTEITQDRVLQELARLAFVDLRKAYNEDGTLKKPHELDDDTAAAMAGLETVTTAIGDIEDPATLATKKVKTWDKKGALELCMRHLGMLNDKIKVDANVTGGVTYTANIPKRGA
jgi:phage terminase small subunit